MKKKNLICLLTCLMFIVACNKPETEVIKKDYKKITIVRTNASYTGVMDSLIIELNNNSTIKVIKAYGYGIGNIYSYQMNKNFVYQPNSIVLDSSIIIISSFMRPANTYIEKYFYENGRIVKVHSPVIELRGENAIITYTYDQEDKIIHKNTTYKYHQDTTHLSLYFKYVGNNLYSSLSSDSNVYPQFAQSKYLTFDDKINPLNNLFRKCNYPLDLEISSFFPEDYVFSENNPTTMKLNSSEIKLTYTYNQFNYPVKISSFSQSFNVRIYYE